MAFSAWRTSVLLLDEADVFLAQRSRFDIRRNALVSVFLRTLEYYNGILFLTTNRVGTIDEAFKSRIHMSLYYRPLNEMQLKQIFLMNIDKLRKIEHERFQRTGKPAFDIREDAIIEFARQHCAKTREAGGRWNGRQIRNAFQIVSSLARHKSLTTYEEARKSGQQVEERAPVLDQVQFETVERATNTFKEYMEQTKGYNDADLAHILGERSAFFYQGRQFSSGPVTRQPPAAGETDIHHTRTPSSNNRQYYDYSAGGSGSGYHPSDSPANYGSRRAAHATTPSRDGFDTRDPQDRGFSTPPYRGPGTPNTNHSSERFTAGNEGYDRGNRGHANAGYGDMPPSRRADYDPYGDF